MSLVSTEWLNNNHSKVKIIDSSWHMPSTNRNAYEEYKKEHIKNAIFFDIDKFSDEKTLNGMVFIISTCDYSLFFIKIISTAK